MAETIIGLFKAEVIHRQGSWRNFDAVECATTEWVDWFNNRRLLEPIGNIPPSEAEVDPFRLWKNQTWTHNQDQSASGEPGVVQIERARRMIERPIKPPKFPTTKSLGSLDFTIILRSTRS